MCLAPFPQSPFNTFAYSIVGDGKAQRFFVIDQQSGRITLSSSIRDDPDLGYVIRVRAVDGGGRVGEALVTITVNRNMQPPRFSPEQYTASIQDNEPLASSFTQVQATDDDNQVRS